MSTRTAIRIFVIGALCLTLAACESSEERAEAYFESAQTLIADGDIDRAIVELRNVFELVPNHAEARRALARVQTDRGNLRGAFTNFLRLVEQVPDDVEGRTALAELSFEMRNWEEFTRHGERAIALAPDAPRSQIIDLALQYRTSTLENDLPAIEAITTRAEEMMAQTGGGSLLEQVLFDAYVRSGDARKALVQLDNMIARAPAVRSNYDRRLALLSQIGDEAATEAHLRNVVDVFPDDREAKTALVRYLLFVGDLDKAETFLREISDPMDSDPAMFTALIQFLRDVRGNDVARAELEAALPDSAEPDRLRMMLAVIDYEEGQRDQAMASLEEIVSRAEPSDLTNTVKITLSRMRNATGDAVGAQQLIREVLAADVDNVEALKIDAARLIETDETDAAIANLRRALDTEPDDVHALRLMSDAYTRAGSRDLARDFLAQAVDVSGNAPEPSLNYARVLLADGDEQAAEEVLLAALRREPAHEEILVMLGAIYIGSDDFTRADMAVQQLRRIGSEPAEALANQLQVRLLAKREGSAEALSFLEEVALSADAGLNERVELLRARLAVGQTARALEMAEELVAQAPDDPNRQLLLALTRAASGDLETARTDMQALLEKDPTQVRLWQQLYRIVQIETGPDAASAVLSRALAALPRAPALLWMKASELEVRGEIDAAIAIYEDLYARDTGSLVIANNLASLLVTYKEDSASVERAWTIARRLRDTNVPAFQDTYGWLAFRRGDAETALPYLENAASGLPNDAVVQYHLAEVYNAMNRPQDAIASYQRALDVMVEGDTRPQIERARQRLAQLQQSGSEPENQ
ncbi:MAG: tetratricopeptide repeat protein [Roseobacter sp.]|jgi:tetratricopeptide (TPR) repeat protein|nr:tetratricopeptide repeat protein [Roseobacter sp.]